MNQWRRSALACFAVPLFVWFSGAPAVGEEVSASFDLESHGEDVLWTLPAPMATTHAGYRMSYEVTLLEAAALWDSPFGQITVKADVTDRLPEDLRADTKVLAGPLPIVAFADTADYPEDADPPGFSADVEIGIDADGVGYFSVTNMYLGDVEYDVAPGTPPIVVTLTSVRMVGSLHVEDAIAIQPALTALGIAEGATADVEVTLSGPPANDVVVSVAWESGDEGVHVASGEALRFTPVTWDVPQVVTLSADKDADGENGEAMITLVADDVAPASISVTGVETDCDDNDVADDAELASGAAADCDANGVPDVCELDSDGDGVIDACDECPNDPTKVVPGDCGCGGAEGDDDGDGVLNCDDACPGTTAGVAITADGCPVNDCDGDGVDDAVELAESPELDCNGNGLPDACDADGDGDGVIDDCDNCPAVFNPEQDASACSDDEIQAGQSDATKGTPPELPVILCGSGILTWLLLSGILVFAIKVGPVTGWRR